jgi:predicted phosphate transport protein (TIGR00153 family)
MGEASLEAANFLKKSLHSFDSAQLLKQIDAMHKLEHTADSLQHEVSKKLAKEFVTPIDREDILLLSNQIDNITDKIEDILVRIYMFNIKKIRSEVLAFTDFIVEMCELLIGALKEFANFKKSEFIGKAIVDINSIEGKGDALYIESIHKLFAENSSDIKELIAWKEILETCERCCDVCEDTANTIESIILKNS